MLSHNIKINECGLLFRKRLVMLMLFLCVGMNVNAQKVVEPVDDMLRAFYDTVRTERIPTGEKEFRIGGKKVIIYGTRHNIRDMNAVQYLDMGGGITNGKPTLVLTEGNSFASADLQESVKFGGEASYCRYLAYQEGIPISSWDPYWGEVYYDMVKKYRAEDIFIGFLGELFDIYVPTPGTDFNQFYRSFVVWLESLGYPVKKEQREPDYFLQRYKGRYGISFDDRYTPEGLAKLARKRQSGPEKAIMSRFGAVRDKRLVEVIRESLKTHNKIFVQAGAVHRASMERVLDSALRIPAQKIKSILPEVLRQEASSLDPRWSAKGSFFKEVHIGKKTVILWASDQHIDRTNDSISLQMEKVIKKMSPTMILTEDYQIIDSNARATYRKYGEGGLARSIAQKKGTPLLAWGRYLSCPYYELRTRYTEQPVLNAILFYYLKRDLPSYRCEFDTFQNYYAFVAGQLETDGFPRRYNQANFGEVFQRCLTLLPELTSHGILSDIDPILNSAQFTPIVSAFKEDRANDIVRAIENGLQYHDRIFLQADKEILKVLFGNGQHGN